MLVINLFCVVVGLLFGKREVIFCWMFLGNLVFVIEKLIFMLMIILEICFVFILFMVLDKIL